MRNGTRRNNEVLEEHSFVGAGPLLVDANIAGTILTGGNLWALSKRLHQWMLLPYFHWVLAPKILWLRCGDSERVVEGGEILLDTLKQFFNVIRHRL
ncbi:MAG: hypothetical protein A3G81_19250 [Betaproteobacteria bacterium RIFCSPLOWO2_12_FULL_65_14]|nr:MAG: hypothetical protein A3G81_19250 [Betaproteobacteria bacterium RIFCSPLOWO2_12_FULL_65_14]